MATEAHGAAEPGLVFHPMDQFLVKPLFDGHEVGIFTLTNVTLWMALTVAAIFALLVLGTSGRATIPSRMQSIAELAYDFVRRMVEVPPERRLVVELEDKRVFEVPGDERVVGPSHDAAAADVRATDVGNRRDGVPHRVEQRVAIRRRQVGFGLKQHEVDDHDRLRLTVRGPRLPSPGSR